jgi:hypothetical protein
MIRSGTRADSNLNVLFAVVKKQPLCGNKPGFGRANPLRLPPIFTMHLPLYFDAFHEALLQFFGLFDPS